ncbi:MAG: ERCC4 domain-containing protein [Dethiobacter sp.]|nr:ERCC4 domain-containing protein [Dethiobacter sp.]MBS3902694.1 ERCC4 domain-containing protein [Dethiobacter sp.]MBS3989733.1 ERCC4 domain-containing protein [Dethiobacter sp.]
MRYHYSEKEIKTLAACLTILHDTREQENGHILSWLDKSGIPHKQRSLQTGDYSIMLPACPELGLPRDIYLAAAVERKSGVDELVETMKDRTRFENELIRGQQLEFFVVLVEDADGYGKIVRGEYRSKYEPKALQASLAALSLRYSCPVHFVPREHSARWMYSHLYWHALERLRRPPAAAWHWRNGSGCPDPTASEALKNVARNERG